jgi:hypothetical protein
MVLFLSCGRARRAVLPNLKVYAALRYRAG